MKIRLNKKYRIKAGLTRRELAEKVSVSAYTIKAWEYGFYSPTDEHVEALEQIFKVSKRKLFSIA